MLTAGAWQSTVGSLDAWVFTAALALLFPAIDYIVYNCARSKFTIYYWNILAEWFLVAACLWVVFRRGLTLVDIGQQPGKPLRLLVTLVVLAASLVVLRWLKRKKKKNLSAQELKKAVGKAARMLPASEAEQKVFIVLALTAGLCEEFLYRGWLLQLFGGALGSLWVGLVLSSLVFGAAHVYQGRNGVISSSVLGVAFGLIFMVSGSLLPGQTLHAVIDIKNGIALGKRVRDREPGEMQAGAP